MAISRPTPRAAPVTTATLPLSSIDPPHTNWNAASRYHSPPTPNSPAAGAQKWPDARRRRARRQRRRWPFFSAGGSAPPGVQGGDVRGAEDEHDRRVVDEHHEGDQDAERAVDLVVDADLADVDAEELLGDLPQARGQQAA